MSPLSTRNTRALAIVSILLQAWRRDAIDGRAGRNRIGVDAPATGAEPGDYYVFLSRSWCGAAARGA
jgi:hypothetical protein